LRGVRDIIYGSALYRMSLRGRFHHGLAFQPADPWDGDAARANELFRGIYSFGGEVVDVGPSTPWPGHRGSESWRAALQGFDWLRDFRAAGGDAAERAARSLAGAWLTHCGQYDAFAWRPDILSRRLINWCLNADLLIRNAELTYRSNLLRSLGRQARHLARTADKAPPGPPAIKAAAGLALLGYCLPESRAYAETGLRLLTDQAQRQIHSDGGHVSRDPELLHAVLQDLVLLKRVMMDVGEPPPEPLVHAVDRITPTLRMFRHGEGGLALFNGATEGDPAAIEVTVKRSGVRGRPNLSAPRTGFERMEGGRTVVIADFGGPHPEAGVGHAGLLSFELSHRRERIVVNSGSARPAAAQWSKALASTAAHSTLTVADTNAIAVPEAGRKRRRRMAAEATRTESADATWLEMSHDGYRNNFGLVHRRRLYLDAAGADFRGEDVLEPLERRGNGPTDFAIRFHLHPLVRASLSQGGTAVILSLKSGRGWRFRVAGAAPQLEESIHLGDGSPRRSTQIVLAGSLAEESVAVQWAFGLIDGPEGQEEAAQEGLEL
jgi:uncharacterized heparinase superfamily protein